MKEENEFYNNPKKFEKLNNNGYHEYLSGEELDIHNEDDEGDDDDRSESDEDDYYDNVRNF